MLKVLGNDGGGQGDEAAEDPDQADRQQDPYPRSLWLQRLYDRLNMK